jgi:hypothetical protein
MEVFPMKDIVINEIYASALISIFEGSIPVTSL